MTARQASRRQTPFAGRRGRRRRPTHVGTARAKLPEPGSQDGKDALVLHGLIRVAPHINRSQAKEVLGWGGERLDRALGALRTLAQEI